jgi:hypothetical protein
MLSSVLELDPGAGHQVDAPDKVPAGSTSGAELRADLEPDRPKGLEGVRFFAHRVSGISTWP